MLVVTHIHAETNPDTKDLSAEIHEKCVMVVIESAPGETFVAQLEFAQALEWAAEIVRRLTAKGDTP